MSQKYFLITYGCQMNKSDSERIASVLENIDYKPALKENEADLILINMCSVRQPAVDRVYGNIKNFEKLKKENGNLKTILTGCVLKSDLEKFKNHFDHILSIKTLSRWPEFLKENKYFYYPNPRDLKFTGRFKAKYLNEKASYSKSFSVFIPISSGCDNFCTFCAVPYTRGSLICRDHREILKEVKFAIETGAKEIWILGQNVNDYQTPTDKIINFPKLLKMIDKIPGNFWIRFTSPHPKNFSDELIDIMANCEKITEYLNLPVQSGDDEILKKMNRPYTVEKYKNIVQKIREKIPEIALSTDVIVGFPGETKEQFKNTVKLFKEIKYDMAYIAKFSPRPGTIASKFKDNVSPKEKERRYKVLTEILKKTALEKNKKFIGKEIEVLMEARKNQFLIGKSRHYKTVKFESNQDLVGQFVKIKITNAMPWGLSDCLF